MSNSTTAPIPDYTDDYMSRSEKKNVATVKEMDIEDRPREKAKLYGIGSLTKAELLAMILRTGTKGNPITTLCRDLMTMNGDLIGNLERCTVEQLKEINGIGEMKAYQIVAIMEILRRYCDEKVGERPQIRDSSTVFQIMRHEIGYLAYEEMWVLFLNRGNRVIGKMRVSSGGGVSTVFDVKKILKNALFAHAEGLVLVHNHPSGTHSPSGADDQITRKMKEAASQLDLTMLDHIIVTADNYYSYMDMGRL